MASNLNTSLENTTTEKINILEDVVPKYDSKTVSKRGIEREIIDLYNNRRRSRVSVYNSRSRLNPANIEGNSKIEINDNDYAEMLQKKYLFIISKYEIILKESSNMNKTLEENANLIEELSNELVKLKEEKKKKQKDIVNYLSNKESLEEFYKNKLSYLINQNNENKSKFEDKEININLDTLKNQNQIERQLYDIGNEKEMLIKIEDIKKSDKNKFTDQVIVFSEEILQKKGEDEVINKIKSKIKIAYNIFYSEISSNTNVNKDSIISHFFSRIGLYISNLSLGLYSETNVNKFLRYLLKINSINVEIFHMMKFLNKKYKEQKDSMKNKIINLKKKNELLKEKKNQNDKKVEKYEKIIDKNKELIKNLKQQNNTIDEKKEKRKYSTLDGRPMKSGSNLRLLTEINNLNQTEHINKKTGNEEVPENIPKITLNDENLIKYQNTEIPNNEMTNKYKSNKKLNTIKRAKSNSQDKNLEKNKSNNEIFASDLNNKNKNIIITKNTKILLKKTGKQYKINKGNKEKKENQLNPKYNKNIYIINNINNSENIQTKNNIYDTKSNNININSNGNLNYYNNYSQDYKANVNKNNNYTNINPNKNETNRINTSRNNPIIKINNSNNSDKEAKNKKNYNFHDILQINSKKPSDKSYKVENKMFTPSNTYNSSENKTQRIFQKSTYDFKNPNNKGNYSNNGKDVNVNVKLTDNYIKKADTVKSNTGINNANNSYKVSVYSKRNEKKSEKI